VKPTVPSLSLHHAGFGASSPTLSAAPSAWKALPAEAKAKKNKTKAVGEKNGKKLPEKI